MCVSELGEGVSVVSGEIVNSVVGVSVLVIVCCCAWCACENE